MKRLAGSMVLYLVACGSSRAPKPSPAQPAPEVDSAPPVARVVDVVEKPFGIDLEDPYRWMEQPENAGELRDWLVGQGAYTRRKLDRVVDLARFRERIRTLELGADEVSGLQVRGDQVFFYRAAAGESVKKLYVQRGDDAPRLLIDPTTDPRAAPSINNYAASPDGSLVAYNLAAGGSEITDIRVVETANGSLRPDVIPRIWGEFPANWLPDGSGFFYTQMSEAAFADPAADKVQGMVAKRHLLGTDPASDPDLLGPSVGGSMEIDPREFPIISAPPGSKWLTAVAVGARSEQRLYIAPLASANASSIPWQRVAEYDDVVTQFAIRGDDLYLLVQNDVPNGVIVHVDAHQADLAKARVFVPGGPRVIEGVGAAADGLYVFDLVDGASRLRRFAYDGTGSEIALPPAVTARAADADPRQPGVWIRVTGYTSPTAYYRVDAAGKLARTPFADPAVVDMSMFEVVRTEATSTDGVAVPMTILRKKGLARDGKRPTLLTGYGGYGITYMPAYWPTLAALLEQDAIYAVCHVRGGGARGRSWHLAGKGNNKPQGIRDFVACSKELARSGYTSAAHIAARGASMGGVLIGRAITESPDAFGAAVISVGILNPVRYLEAQNGANQTAELEATPDTAEGLRTLVAMDAYQNVKEGVRYPATMLVVGLNDQRVAPWMSAKFAARMQASGTPGPVLVRVSGDEGHGVGSTRLQEADRLADQWAFALWQLGHPDFSSAK